MIVGGYELHLYCDGPGPHRHNEFPRQYTDEYGSVCRQQARADGWYLSMATKKAYCPKCAPTRHQRDAEDMNRMLDGLDPMGGKP